MGDRDTSLWCHRRRSDFEIMRAHELLSFKLHWNLIKRVFIDFFTRKNMKRKLLEYEWEMKIDDAHLHLLTLPFFLSFECFNKLRTHKNKSQRKVFLYCFNLMWWVRRRRSFVINVYWKFNGMARGWRKFQGFIYETIKNLIAKDQRRLTFIKTRFLSKLKHKEWTITVVASGTSLRQFMSQKDINDCVKWSFYELFSSSFFMQVLWSTFFVSLP